MASVYEQRLFQADKCHVPKYDASKLSTYALMLDASFFYGIVMQNDYWPMQNFGLAARITLDETLKM